MAYCRELRCHWPISLSRLPLGSNERALAALPRPALLRISGSSSFRCVLYDFRLSGDLSVLEGLPVSTRSSGDWAMLSWLCGWPFCVVALWSGCWGVFWVMTLSSLQSTHGWQCCSETEPASLDCVGRFDPSRYGKRWFSAPVRFMFQQSPIHEPARHGNIGQPKDNCQRLEPGTSRRP